MKNFVLTVLGLFVNKNIVSIKPAEYLILLKQNWNVVQNFFHLVRLSWIRLFGSAKQKKRISKKISVIWSLMILSSIFILILFAITNTEVINKFQLLWNNMYIFIVGVFPFWKDIAQMLNDLRLIWQDIFTDTDLDTQLNSIKNMIYYIGRHSSNFFIHLL